MPTMSVKVFDSVGVLTSAQRAELEGITSPHTVKLLLQNTSSKPEFQNVIKTCVDSANTICAGVSPKLRYTWTEIGIDTGIRSGDYNQVGRAGNVELKIGLGGDSQGYVDGFKAIISRAQVLAHRETAVPTPVVIHQPRTETVVEHPVSAWPFVIGFGVIGALVGVVWFISHRQQKRTQRALENAEREAAEMAQRNIRDQRWADEIEKRVGDIPPIGKSPEVQKKVAEVPPRKSTWDDVIERARPQKSPLNHMVNEAQKKVATRTPPRRSRTPAPVIVTPQVIPVPIYVPPVYEPPTPARSSFTRADTPAPTRRKDDTPAPSSFSSSSFGGGFSGGGGGGDVGGGFSGGGGGGDL
jgi:uncharacterized membrane protein YgcG